MRILTNGKTGVLLCRILICVAAFVILATVLICSDVTDVAIYIFACSLCMAAAILFFCYRHLREQDEIIEAAAARITDYIRGDQDVRIECDGEGEPYRLFHEVNSLASILNAHAESEKKAKEFLEDTIADISHQLKTPLAALNIYNGILQDEAEDPSAVHEFADLSEQELERIETLVQNLLKIAKLDAGTMVIERSEEIISEMMDSIQRHFAFRAAREEKRMVLSGNEDISLSCDRNWLIEAISNIVKNAFDHTQRGDEIHIEWKRFASIVQIVIEDDGNGIHPEDMHYIFKRFYRSRFSKDTQGAGLGLPLAKAIIEAHDGTIEVDSEPGVGTVFTISLLVAAN